VSDAENATTESRPARLFGHLAEFKTVDELLFAAGQCRDRGFTRWDCHTPFPVHGLDRAMGVKQTILPWIVLAGGLFGCGLGFGLQWFTNAFDYPFVVSGKPVVSLAIYIPVMFELTVLCAALAAFISMLAMNNLPQLYHAVFTGSRFPRATSDRFFVCIEAKDPIFDDEETRAFLEGLGASHFERLEE